MPRVRLGSLVVALALAEGCYGSVTLDDAGGPADVGVDAAVIDDSGPSDGGSDVGADAGADAGSGVVRCARGEVAYATPLLPGLGVDVVAVAASSVDGTFAIGANAGGQGLRLAWSESPPSVASMRSYGPGGASEVDDVAVDLHGDLIVGGLYQPPATIEREALGPTGSTALWQGFVARMVVGVTPDVTTLGDDRAIHVARLGDGFVVAGSGTIVTGRGHCDAASGAFVLGLGLDGDPAWVRCLAGAGTVEVRAVTTHDAGETYVVGDFTGTLSIDDGASEVISAGGVDGFVARIIGRGTPAWVRGVGTADDDVLLDVTVTGGSVVAVGTIGPSTANIAPADPPLGGTDGALVALTLLTGRDERLVRVGGPSSDTVRSVAADRCGAVWLAGDAGALGYVRRLDAAETGPASLVVEAEGLSPSAIATSSDGAHVVVVGRYDLAAELGTASLPPTSGGWEAFVLGME